MQSALVSVIVPVYNVEAYLRDCVDSILAQTYPNLEIILVDDGSPDGCPAICDAYAKADSRIRVIHKQNGGLSSARNTGLDTATGTWIVFVDSDDLIAPGMIETLVNACPDEDTVAAVGFARFPDGEIPCAVEPAEAVCCRDIRAFTRRRSGLFVWGITYSRSLIEKLHLRFDSSLENLEDVAWNMCYLGHAAKLYYIPGSLYHYRQNPTSITSRCSDKRWQVRSWFSARSSIFAWFAEQERHCGQDVLRYALRYCANNIFAECVVGNLTCGDYMELRELPADTGVSIPELLFEKWLPRLYFSIYTGLIRLRNRIRH